MPPSVFYRWFEKTHPESDISIPSLRMATRELMREGWEAASAAFINYVHHSPRCWKDPLAAIHPEVNACTCGLNELLGLDPMEN